MWSDADGASQSARRPNFSIVLPALLLSVLAVANILLDSRSSTLELQFTIHVFVIFFSAWRIGNMATLGDKAWMQLYFYLFQLFWFGLAPLAQYASDGGLLVRRNDDALFDASVVSLLTLIAFEIGRSIRLPLGCETLSTPGPSPVAVSNARLWLFFALSVLSTIFILPSFGGLAIAFSSRLEFDLVAQGLSLSGNFARQALLYALLSVIPLLALISCVVVMRDGRRVGTVRWAFIALVGVNVVANSPFTHPRSWIATCLVSLILASGIVDSLRRALWFLVGLMTGLFIAFPVANFFRYRTQESLRLGDIFSRRFAESGDYDAFRQLTVGVEFVSARGWDYGYQLLGPVFFWIPRSVWPDKPGDTGVLLATFVGDDYTNLSAPLSVELYVAGGFVAVSAGFLIVGILWRYLDEFHARSRADREFNWSRLLVPCLTIYQFSLLRGSLLTVSGLLACIVGISFVVPFFLSRRLGADRRYIARPSARASVKGEQP